MFSLNSEFKLSGDQPQAVEKITKSFKKNNKENTLLGVTGSGKTFTMANIIQNLNLPTLVISHNKTLAAQLYDELQQFFPDNAVEYFVSFYDYYQPEAYIPSSDTYIEKDSDINDEIDRLRLSATSSLLSRKDVIIVASVSCIYGLGSPIDYENQVLYLEINKEYSRKYIIKRLLNMQYNRNDVAPQRGDFRINGDTIEIFIAYKKRCVRLEFWGDTLEKISWLNIINRNTINEVEKDFIFPAKHFMTTGENLEKAFETINEELKEQIHFFQKNNKLLEAHRIQQRTEYDMEMLREIGYCSGIENYSRHLSHRKPGSKPYTLMDYFPKEFLTIIDESHVTFPQLKAMYKGDYSRKKNLVDFGFRLPSALDNRPLKFSEFQKSTDKILYVSATPAEYEISRSNVIAEQIIRPTGLIDPEIIVKPIENQIDDLIGEINKRIEKKERVLVTTLTIRMSEELTDYLEKANIRVHYLHSKIDTLERIKIITSLRKGEFDVLVGINLLREGLDLPEVSLVAILDADKQGFLRSETALVQTMGRAARHINGKVIMYADNMTKAMKAAISITNKRRKKQLAFNKKNNITPKSTIRKIDLNSKLLDLNKSKKRYKEDLFADSNKNELLEELNTQMLKAASDLNFEYAAELRDIIKKLQAEES